MSTVGPVDHIARRALPWRTQPHLTECGKPVTELGDRVVTRDAIEARIRGVGKQRAAPGEADPTCDGCGRITAGLDAGDPMWPAAVQVGHLAYHLGACTDCRLDDPGGAHGDGQVGAGPVPT